MCMGSLIATHGKKGTSTTVEPSSSKPSQQRDYFSGKFQKGGDGKSNKNRVSFLGKFDRTNRQLKEGKRESMGYELFKDKRGVFGGINIQTS